MPALILLVVAAQAMAWEHEGAVWPSVPVALCIQAEGVDPGWADDAAASVDAWNTAAEPFGMQLFTSVPDCSQADVVIELTDATTISLEIATDGLPVEVGGCSYLGTTAASISAGVGLATPHEDVDEEPCAGAVSLRRILAHELGHVLGLAHSCEEAAPCTDPDAHGAIMYWATPPCEVEYLPQPDDIAGIKALYVAPECDSSGGASTGDGTPADTADYQLSSVPESRTTGASCGCTSTEGAPRSPALVLLFALAVLSFRNSPMPNRTASARRDTASN